MTSESLTPIKNPMSNAHFNEIKAMLESDGHVIYTGASLRDLVEYVEYLRGQIDLLIGDGCYTADGDVDRCFWCQQPDWRDHKNCSYENIWKERDW